MNVSRKVRARNFCSKRCKRRWEEKVGDSHLSTVRTWKIGMVMGTLKFIPSEARGHEFSTPIATKFPSSTHFFADLEPMDEQEVLEHLIAKSL